MTLPDATYQSIMHQLQHNIPIRKIANNEQISKTTVMESSKRLKSTGSILPSKKKRKSIYDPFIEKIKERIRYYISLQKSLSYRKQQKSITYEDIYHNLQAEGFQISLSKTKELLRQEKNRLKKSYLDIFYAPGEIAQFDWGQSKIQINEKTKTIYFAVFALPYSNYRKVYITEKMDSKSFCYSFKKFANDMGGIPPVLLIDNMKIAKKNASYRKNEVKLTRLFSDLSFHYSFNVRFCTPYKPNQKGTVENAVKVVKNKLKLTNSTFKSIDDLRKFITKTFDELNIKKHHEKNDTCYNLMLHEKPLFSPLPVKEYTYFNEVERKVRNTCLISFKGNSYSVPEEFKGEKILVRYNDKVIYILSKKEDILDKYIICKNKKKKKYRIWNMLHKVKVKSAGFDNSREKRSMPSWLQKLYEKTFNKNTNDFIALLEIIKKYPKDTMKKVLRLNGNNYSNLTIEKILNSILLIC